MRNSNSQIPISMSSVISSSTSTSKSPRQLLTNFSSPHVYIHRNISVSRRLKEIRNLPEYDSRDLLADPLKAFSTPDALYEEKLTLEHDISSLKSEVLPLREQSELISKQFEEQDRDPLEEAEERSLQQQYDSYQNEITTINKNMAVLSECYTVKNEEDLKGQIQDFRHDQSVLEAQIDDLKQKVEESQEALEKANNSPNIEPIQANDQKISELQAFLDELKNEEQELMKKFESLLNHESENIQANTVLNTYLRQLRQLQHLKATRSVEMKKTQKNYESQKQFMETVKTDKQRKEQERKNRETWRQSYKIRESQRSNYEEPSEKEVQNQEEEDEILNTILNDSQNGDAKVVQYETIKRKVIHRRKHRRYHNRNPSNIEEGDQNEEILPPTENPIMFSTEVENTDSLAISKDDKVPESHNA